MYVEDVTGPEDTGCTRGAAFTWCRTGAADGGNKRPGCDPRPSSSVSEGSDTNVWKSPSSITLVWAALQGTQPQCHARNELEQEPQEPRPTSSANPPVSQRSPTETMHRRPLTCYCQSNRPTRPVAKVRSQDNRSSRTDVAQAGNTTNSCRAQRRFLVGTRHDAGHNLMIGATLLPEIS